MLQWSDYFQVPEYLEASRISLLPQELRTLVLKACHIDNGAKILDVGCGTGYFTRYLAEGPEELTLSGIDSQEAFINYAEKEALKKNLNISFFTADALQLPFSDESFDVVVSHTFLTSVSDPSGAMREMHRVCKNGGSICSVTAMSFSPQLNAPGKYPPDCLWYDDYICLNQKFWAVCNQLSPTKYYTSGIPTTEIPGFFVESGLKDVSATPLGKVFSLSNAAFSPADRKKYIDLMYRASLEKLQNFDGLPGFRYYMTEAESKKYRALLGARHQYLLEHLNDNTIWEWDGGANCLIVGRREETAGEDCAEGKPALLDTKFKDAKPEDTVRRIRTILEHTGFTTAETWIDSHVPGCYSVRIDIQGTGVGQNGKGMTKELALASGYAELMERLQTGCFYIGRQDPETAACYGFTYVPEEVYLTAEDILLKNEKWFDSLYSAVLANSAEFISKIGFLDLLVSQSYAVTDKPFIAIPFFHITTGEKVHIPVSVLQGYYATNGTCAGNSKYEAIVQGLSEIVERHHNLLIHNKCIAPPTVPDSYLQKFPNIYSVITAIRRQSNYSVLVKDCSLGEGYPVVATALIDLEKHTYIVKFGSHPVFEIALERSMTELFQGRPLETAAVVSAPLYNAGDAQKTDIVHNVLKNATGHYHYRFFGGIADYEFVPPEDRSTRTNRELYQYALSFFHDKDLDIYIRNASYLDFPTYQILVPSYSEAYNTGILRLKELKTHERVIGTLYHLSQASPEDIRRLVTYLKYKEYFALENTASFLLSLPMNTECDFKNFQILYLIASLKENNLNKAAEISDMVCRLTMLPEERDFFSCFSMLLRLVQAESGMEPGIELLQCFYRPETAAAVAGAFLDTDRLIEKYGISCDFRCGGCKNAWRCDYPKLRNAILRLKDAFKNARSMKQGMSLFKNTTVFSAREQEVARLYVQGLMRKDIARKLFISENTVKKHLDSIYKKAGTDQRKEVFTVIRAAISI